MSGYRVHTGSAAEIVEQILQAKYTAYLCMMSDHGCACVALDFDHWLAVWAGDK